MLKFNIAKGKPTVYHSIVYFCGFLVLQLNTRLDLGPAYAEESSSLIKITLSTTKLIFPKETY
jgi:hypothetical protein